MASEKRGNIFMILLLIYMGLMPLVLSDVIQLTKIQLSIVAALIIPQFLGFGLFFILYKVLTRKKISEILPINHLGLKNAMFIICICILIQPFMMFLTSITNMFLPNKVAETLTVMTELPIIVSIGVVAINPSIFEEIIFRGIILSEYKNSPIKKAIIVNGLFFGMMHLNITQFVYATLLGVLFSYFVIKTKTIFSSMLGHFVINGSQVALMYFASSQVTEEILNRETNLEQQMMSTIIVGVICIFLSPLIIYLLKYFKKHNEIIQNEFERIETQEDYQNALVRIENQEDFRNAFNRSETQDDLASKNIYLDTEQSLKFDFKNVEDKKNSFIITFGIVVFMFILFLVIYGRLGLN